MEPVLNPSPHETPLVASLTHFSRADLDTAGGKGANLGELMRGGFPVPPGFVVTTAAYDQFVAYHHLNETITTALLHSSNDGAAIRAAFEQASIPPTIAQAIVAAYGQLNQGAVAVRSSATAEDLPGAAFAGQQDTYLNMVGDEAVLDAVRRCWASLWTDRAITYRERLGIPPDTVKIAVVVQRMVVAEAAGVTFSANPVTGARDEVVIDGSPGLGEAVVSGLVTPDHFILRKKWRGWRIVEQQLGQREVIIRARVGGGTEETQGTAAGEPVLPERALRQLAELATAIQKHFGAPQDMEWAWAQGTPFIVQARPITALPTSPPRPNFAQRQIAGNFAEIFAVRPYPLDLDTWIPAFAGAIDPLFALFGLTIRLRRIFDVEDGIVLRINNSMPRPTWRTLFAPVRMVAAALRYDPLRWESDPLLTETLAQARRLDAQELPARSWRQLLERVRVIRTIPLHLAGDIRTRYFPGAAFAVARLRLLLTLLGQTRRWGALLSGAETKTTEVNHALESLADTVRADPTLALLFATHAAKELWSALDSTPAAEPFRAEVHHFLDEYGHREATLGTALEPTWKDAPDIPLGIIKSAVLHPLTSEAGTAGARSEERGNGNAPWRVARDAVLRHPLLRFAPLRAAFLHTLERARLLVPIREDTHFYATVAMPLLRRTLLEMGNRLVQQGVLDTPADIFHLTLAELERMSPIRSAPALADVLRASVARRKAARAALEDTPLVDLRLLRRNQAEGDALLRGTPGSPGVAEGPVCLVRDGTEFNKLMPGDVLVAPYTNPSWTPLFQRAAAVIVDTGSAASHAAIVAREYGIPAVMSTISAIRTLQDGERVRVDGSAGAVFRVEPTGDEASTG